MKNAKYTQIYVLKYSVAIVIRLRVNSREMRQAQMLRKKIIVKNEECSIIMSGTVAVLYISTFISVEKILRFIKMNMNQ